MFAFDNKEQHRIESQTEVKQLKGCDGKHLENFVCGFDFHRPRFPCTPPPVKLFGTVRVSFRLGIEALDVVIASYQHVLQLFTGKTGILRNWRQ